MMNKGVKLIVKWVMRIVVGGGFLAAVCVAGINFVMVETVKSDIVSIDKLQKADCILVLGAYVRPNGVPSAILKDRLNTGYEIFKAGKAPKFLLSGDHGRKSYDEVNGMKDYIEKKGVDTELIFLDHAGFSTYESIYRARDIFEANKMIVVTQAYHLPRALYLAKKMGIEAQGVASEDLVSKKMILFKAREALARTKDFVFVNIIKPKPTYLGDAIPVSGNGTVTHDK